MSKFIPATVTILAIALTSAVARSGSRLVDDEASNVPHVAVSSYGRCYAKSVPDSLYGQSGRTSIYYVRRTTDSLLSSYSWFSKRILLECNVAAGDGPVGLSVVRLGPWARGQKASARDLALAMYRGDRLLRSYSTLDIAGSPDNVQASESHYTVIDSVIGYRYISGNRYRFDVRTIDGRRLAFDPGTGERITAQEPKR